MNILKNINKNFEESLTGISVAITGLSLLIDRNYFFWPPELRSMMNSEYVDIFFFILGISILICALTGNRNKIFQHIFLILAGAAILMLAVTQWWHVCYANEFRMAHSVISDCIIFILIIRCAYKS